MSTALVPTDNQLVPVYSVKDAVERHNEIVNFVKTIMREGVDYGRVPGTDKDTLFKPGAEKLSTFFGLSPRFIELLTVEDWTGSEHNREPFFFYKYKCELYRGDKLVSECTASCNSWEERYRYRKGGRTCPECGKVGTIIKGKPEYGGGWLCFSKKDGCGYKFLIDDERITSQNVDKVPNERIYDQVNTIVKQSQKRAFVGAVLIGVNASEFFTQDMEDLVMEGEYTVSAEQPKQQNAPAQQIQRKPEVKQTVATALEPPDEPPFDDGTSGELVQQPATVAPQAQVQAPPQPANAEFVEGVLTYRLNGQVKEVLVSRKAPDGIITIWKQADKQVALSEDSLRYYAGLFKANKHISNHLNVHFPGNATLKTLTWEEIAGLYAAMVEGKFDKRWYPDGLISEQKAKTEKAKTFTKSALLERADKAGLDIFLLEVAKLLNIPDIEKDEIAMLLLPALVDSVEKGAYSGDPTYADAINDFCEAYKDNQKANA